MPNAPLKDEQRECLLDLSSPNPENIPRDYRFRRIRDELVELGLVFEGSAILTSAGRAMVAYYLAREELPVPNTQVQNIQILTDATDRTARANAQLDLVQRNGSQHPERRRRLVDARTNLRQALILVDQLLANPNDEG